MRNSLHHHIFTPGELFLESFRQLTVVLDPCLSFSTILLLFQLPSESGDTNR